MRTAEKIKSLRIAKGLSQEELGRLIGVQKAAINKYETGRVVNIKRTTLQKLAEVFGVTPADLLDDSEEEMGYYVDQETAELANELKDNPGLRLLFDAGRDMPPEDIIKTLDFIRENLKKK